MHHLLVSGWGIRAQEVGGSAHGCQTPLSQHRALSRAAATEIKASQIGRTHSFVVQSLVFEG